MDERSLVSFTLLGQTACGALIGLAGIQLLGGTDVLGALSFIAIGLLLLIAATVSTLHLGTPQHAPYAILSWRSSWLSREIVGLGLTGGLVALGTLIALLADPIGSHAARTIAVVLAASAGVFLIIAMVQLYSVRTIPEWRLAATAAEFTGTTLRLGAVVAGILAAVAALPDGSIGGAPIWLALMLAIGIGLHLGARRLARGSAGKRPGALLVRGTTADVNGRAMGWFVAGGVAAAAGMVVLALGPALLAAIVLGASLIMLAPVEFDLREHFYSAAPRQGRDVMRPPMAGRAGTH